MTVEAKAVDITSRASVDRLLAEIEQKGKKLAGVLHAAAVLQDGLISNIDAAALDAVIGPKVIGAQHLDAATRDRSLDYFVLFSSATTFIGNPGQGSYVAANGFMEGLARQRRRRGLPALGPAGDDRLQVLAVEEPYAEFFSVQEITLRHRRHRRPGRHRLDAAHRHRGLAAHGVGGLHRADHGAGVRALVAGLALRGGPGVVAQLAAGLGQPEAALAERQRHIDASAGDR